MVTVDLSEFGYRELNMAADLLKAYAKGGAYFLGDDLTLNLNTYSGYVFLSDGDYNIGVLDKNEIKQWFDCPRCGEEGFDSDTLPFERYKGYCSRECFIADYGFTPKDF